MYSGNLKYLAHLEPALGVQELTPRNGLAGALLFIIEDLIDRRAFTVCGLTDIKQLGNGRSNVNFTDDAVGDAMFDAGTSGNKNGGDGSVVDAQRCGQRIDMVKVVAFCQHEDDIAAVFTAHA